MSGNSNTFIDANGDLTEDHVLVSRVWLNRESSNFKDGHGWYDLHSFIPIWASIVQWNFLPYWKSAWTTISCQVCLWYQGSHVIPLPPPWRVLQVNLKKRISTSIQALLLCVHNGMFLKGTTTRMPEHSSRYLAIWYRMNQGYRMNQLDVGELHIDLYRTITLGVVQVSQWGLQSLQSIVS